MEKNNKAILWFVVIILIIGALYYFNKQPSTQQVPSEEKITLTEPLKIGGLVPLSGNGAAYGIPIQRAAEMAIEEINSSGGVLGQQINIVWENGQCDAKEATTAGQKLINIDSVKFIIGGVCSSEALTVSPLAEEKQVILLSPSATSPDLTNAGKFIFRTAPSDALAGKIAAEYAYNKLKLKKGAVISENKDYTQGLRKIFSERFKELGGEIVADEIYEPAAVDFTSNILKVKSKNPEVLYLLPQTPAPGEILVKQIKQKGLKTQLLTAEVLTGRDVVEKNKKLLEGMIGIEGYFDEKGERASKFLASYEEKFKEKPPFPFFMANMHGQVYLLKEAVEKFGLDTTKISEWLITLKDWEGTMGKLTFDENGDPLVSYNILQVKDGKLESLEIFSPQ